MEDDLRALEREVATHGEPAARLRLARALERAGRKLSGRLYVDSVEGVLLCLEEGGAPG